MRLGSFPYGVTERGTGGPDTRRARRRKRLVRAVALLAVPALIGGTGTLGCTGPQKKKAAELALEAVGVVGPAPFLTGAGTDLKGVGSARRGGELAGDSRGAFGGTRNVAHCDKTALIKELTRDSVKAKAWSSARDIDPRDLAAHIDKLTPVVLLHDTLVKNHNYKGNGEITGYLAVLQAGVAVLVDSYARPAVKCNCGNPLRQPETNVDYKASSYTGKRWEGFAHVQITVIKERPKEKGPLTSVPLVDPYAPTKGFDRGTGSDGSKDSQPFPVPTPSALLPTPTGGGSGTPSPESGKPSSPAPSASTPESGTPSSPPGQGTPTKGTPSKGAPSKGTPSQGTPSKPPTGTGPSSVRPPTASKPPKATTAVPTAPAVPSARTKPPSAASSSVPSAGRQPTGGRVPTANSQERPPQKSAQPPQKSVQPPQTPPRNTGQPPPANKPANPPTYKPTYKPVDPPKPPPQSAAKPPADRQQPPAQQPTADKQLPPAPRTPPKAEPPST
ncbi:DUF6777 domain-containing protein [Streptomyces syringium]|uniref:DUF6777 domain-containing protein n=1 Tax=Streptomyces syringium TaxID=76729 RepID=UPI0033D7E414